MSDKKPAPVAVWLVPLIVAILAIGGALALALIRQSPGPLIIALGFVALARFAL